LQENKLGKSTSGSSSSRLVAAAPNCQRPLSSPGAFAAPSLPLVSDFKVGASTGARAPAPSSASKSIASSGGLKVRRGSQQVPPSHRTSLHEPDAFLPES
jgi:hypothetical protein